MVFRGRGITRLLCFLSSGQYSGTSGTGGACGECILMGIRCNGNLTMGLGEALDENGCVWML